jgi:hypothetical protein
MPTILETCEMSNRVANFIEQKGNMPNYVTSKYGNIKMGPFLEMTSSCIVEIMDGRLDSTIEVKGINEASTTDENLKTGKLEKEAYYDYAKRVNEYCNSNAKALPYGLCGVGKVSWMETLFSFAKILRWYYTHNNVLPLYVTVYPWSYSPKIGTTSKTSIPDELKIYLKETKNCQVSNSLIQAKAKELQTGAKIFTFVRDAIEYNYYYNTVRGAVRALTDKKGNCTDLSHLLISLARAAGIPARYVHCSSVKFSKITTGHVWVELYLNGSWVRADASNNNNGLGSYPHDSQLIGTVKRYAELPF